MSWSRTLVALAALAALSWPDVSRGLPPQSVKGRNAFMELKLENAQLVLEGIAVGDFKKIETSAESLILLSKKSEFRLVASKDYSRQSEAFRRSAEDLAAAARAKNLDGATVAYIQMTLNCVKCHKDIREAR